MKLLYAAMLLAVMMGCQKTNVDEQPKLAIFKKEAASCIDEQQQAISKLGFSLADGLGGLLDMVLKKTEGQIQICTK